MIISLKNNKALRELRRTPFRDLETRHHGNTPIVYENGLSPEEWTILRKKLRRQLIVSDVIKISMMGIVIAMTILIFIWLMG